MTDPRRPIPVRLRTLLVLAAVAAFGVAACAGGAAPAASDTPSPPAATVDPGGGGGSGGDSGSGDGSVGSEPGDSGGAGTVPSPIDPGGGQPTIVVPQPGRLNPHPVGALALAASVDGRHVIVKVSWYSGVAPCNVLDSVRVDRTGSVISIGLIEGASQLGVACIEIAQLKATVVDLGTLAPGTWTIRATGSDVTPLAITIA